MPKVMKRICSRCIYDEDTPSIVFDNEGVCNYCKMHDQFNEEYPVGLEGEKILNGIISRIKNSGKYNKYDCIVGVSGGCDSSFLIYKMKHLGLRPLAVHFDNTWNSTIATENIRNVLNKLNIDLFTIVVNNKEYDDIYRSFLLAGVPDLESATDIALAATMNIAANKYNIKYVIEGHSFRTEGISPLGWLYMDGKYIESVHKKFGTLPLKTYPNMKMMKFLKWMIINRIKKIRPLYFIDYNKEKTKMFLADEFRWKWYGGHHLENRFTAFYHSYFLPKRFSIDQRTNSISALIRSGQMKREDGLNIMTEPPYLEDEIIELVKKRLGFSNEEFERIMNIPKKSFRDFKTYKKTFEKMKPLFWILYKMNFVPKSFYTKYTSRKSI